MRLVLLSSILRVFVCQFPGEFSGCEISPVHRAQFTPLGPALCWVLLQEGGQNVSLSTVRAALARHFPLMTLPDPSTTHAALSDLIRQRKVFHAGKGYSLVTPGTYGGVTSTTNALPQQLPQPPPQSIHQHPALLLLSTSEALTKAHGIMETTPAGAVTHAAVQTDLADLLTCQGAADRRASLRVGSRRGLAQHSALTSVATYTSRDLTDMTVKGK